MTPSQAAEEGVSAATAHRCHGAQRDHNIVLQPPSSWIGAPNYYAVCDGCDCNSGAHDPDCNGQDEPGFNQALYGCTSSDWGSFKCVAGVCVSRVVDDSAAAGCGCGVSNALGDCMCDDINTATGAQSKIPWANNPLATSAPSGPSTPSPSSPVADACYVLTSWGFGASECTTQVKSCATFAASTLNASHPHLSDYRAHGLSKVVDGCESTQCGLIGDGTCQAELNTAACGWDGGDCCKRTSRRCIIWSSSNEGNCLDPAASQGVDDPWHAIGRHVLTPPVSAYSCPFELNGSRDPNPPLAQHVAYDVMDVPLAYRTLYENFTAVNESLWEKSNAYTFDSWEALMSGTPSVWSPLPDLPLWAQSYKIEADAIPYRDFPFEGQAGEYLNAHVSTPMDNGMYLELISPNANGTAPDPDLLNTTDVPTSTVPEGYLEDDGLTDYNASVALAWHKDNCTCYTCFCSCEGTVGDKYTLTEGPAANVETTIVNTFGYIPNQLSLKNHLPTCGYNRAVTNSYRVYVDPSAANGDFLLKIMMTAMHDDHSWPMVLTVYEPPNVARKNCAAVDATYGDFIDCCFPYGDDCSSSVGDLVAIDACVSTTGCLGTLYKEIRANKQGFYTIQTKSLGYTGGGYSLNVATEKAPGNSVPDALQIALDSTGGALSYGGSAAFGNITFTGETHQYTFTGMEGDVVSVAAGPDWGPVGQDAWLECGMPYGMGKTCLDTHVVLVGPDGDIVGANNIITGTAQSLLSPAMTPGNMWSFTRVDPVFPFSRNYRVTPLVLNATGTYTVIVGGHTGRTGNGTSYVDARLSPVGGYYLVLDKVGTAVPGTSLRCPTPPSGVLGRHDPANTRPGCENLLWSTWHAAPRKSYRHVNCERQGPVAPTQIRNSYSGGHSFNNHRLLATGTYTLRVRFLQNNCYETGSNSGVMGSGGHCGVAAGPFKMHVSTRNSVFGWNPTKPTEPSVPIEVAVPFAALGNGGVLFDPACAITPIDGACASPQGVLHDTMCYATEAPFDDTDFTEKTLASEMRVSFAADVNDVVCVSAMPTGVGAANGGRSTNPPYDRPQIRLVNSAGAVVAYAETTVNADDSTSLLVSSKRKALAMVEPEVPGDVGVGMYGQTIPATDNYTAIVGGYTPDAKPLVKVFTCPEHRVEYTDVASEILAECRTRLSYSKWDKCASPDGTPLAFSDDYKSVTVGGLAGDFHRVFGNAGLDFKSDASPYGKYYWEIKTAVADSAANDTSTEFDFGIGSLSMEEWALRSSNDARLVMMEFACGGSGGGLCWTDGVGVGHAKLGDTLMFAVDKYSTGMWFGRNGFWDGRLRVLGKDGQGTLLNNFDPNDDLQNPPTQRNFSLCAGTQFFDCRKPPSSFDYADSSTYGDGYYHCCPFRESESFFGIDTEFWPDAYFVPNTYYNHMMGQNWISAALANPVNDGEGSMKDEYYEAMSGGDYSDMTTFNKWFFPMLIASKGQKFTINHGEPGFGDFEYTIPCGFRPLQDLAVDDTDHAAVGDVTTNCWTVGGVCAVYNTGTNTCTQFAHEAASETPTETHAELYSGRGNWSFYYGAAGMTPGGRNMSTMYSTASGEYGDASEYQSV